MRRSDKNQDLFGPEAPDPFDFIDEDLEPSPGDLILTTFSTIPDFLILVRVGSRMKPAASLSKF
jgi:hypothetical protein